MKKYIFLPLFAFISISVLSQDWDIGPMADLSRTTFSIPDTRASNIAIGLDQMRPDINAETNFAVGIFGLYNYKERLVYGGQLFYSKHSISNTTRLNNVQAIQLIPYLSYDFFNIGLFTGIGIGVGYITNIDESIATFEENSALNSIDFPAKFALWYRIKDIAIIEVGGNYSLTAFEGNSEAKRVGLHVGLKIPLNKILYK